MKKIIFLLIIALLSLSVFSGIFLYRQKNRGLSVYGNQIRKIDLGGEIFDVELVSSNEKRALGLSGRKDLCKRCGMLFLFDREGKHSFWMKNMNFDLDIVWITGDVVVAIEKDVSHRDGVKVLNPDVMSDKVLEINPGLSDKLGIKVGDKINFQ